ncbi:5-hydroxytryptamine receptor 2A-like isoform X2 [Centruroides sculpturatus]|uniref:5-hydroxytryptamine receptor 2A-like isoform X2 n=1 Tax=Centruroides sculpturatus TaxID=218467 RepID=UPI000C6D101E|nr:5-hydroxytryptamine receptor 2A-like isoform X2 [Centruroides sculpturatus]XP_023214835.1 5-hydroxytryptamine receptor 2A-like isoform X2 [Centruroides sculpturatus]
MDNLTINSIFVVFATNQTMNQTRNLTLATSAEYIIHKEGQIAAMVLTSLALSLVILATVVGNISVIAAIFCERNLQTVGNGLVLSLAVADLMVACLVMPLGAVYEVRQEWSLGPELCDIWTSCDVLCCTASILHLLAIAVDRFWAVTNIDYVRKRNGCHIGFMILLVWGIAFFVSFPPIFGWKDPDFQYRIEVEKRCLVSQDVAYQLFATCATFYVPLVAILFLYWKIYRVARKRIRHKPGGKIIPRPPQASPSTLSPPFVSELTVISNNYSSHPSSDNSMTASMVAEQDFTLRPMINKSCATKHRKESLKTKRERKAAKTLAIITGIFVICWLPFFVVALLMPLCNTCQPEDYVFSIFLWLGYANSMINPIIYTIFSPDFRAAFERMLCNKRASRIR